MTTPSTAVKPLLAAEVSGATRPFNMFTPANSNRHQIPKPSSTSSASSCGGRRLRGPKKTSPRIVFGHGVLTRLPAELGRLHVSAPLIVASPSRFDVTTRVRASIPNLGSRLLDPDIIARFPTRDVDSDDVPDICGQDCVVSVGGGSAVAVARLISLREGVPHICIPTTYSGRELMVAMPSCAAEPRDRRRKGRRGPGVSNGPNPAITTIIYDESLTGSSPSFVPAPTGAAADSVAKSSKSSKSRQDTSSLWSFMNLPGV